MELNKKLEIALYRTVPIEDPKYIVGEDKAIESFNNYMKNSEGSRSNVIGVVVLGQVGNGKTHLLRHLRLLHKADNINAIYIPDMFVGGPLVEAMNSIYRSMFSGTGNHSLNDYINEWNIYKISNEDSLSTSDNRLIKYLSMCNNEVEENLLLEYFSGSHLVPDQFSFIKRKFGFKKQIIRNDVEFSDLICDSLEFINLISGKRVLLLFDEIDRVYSSETNKISLTKSGTKLLTSYRMLFDALNNRGVSGVIAIGATPEAWDVLSNQSAFERRFKDNNVILSVPKSIMDCEKFVRKRCEENNIELSSDDIKEIKKRITSIDESKRKTWGDLMTVLRRNRVDDIVKSNDPASEVLRILTNSIAPMTWKEISSESELLIQYYPKGQPTSLLNKLSNEGKLRINPTRPRTYESLEGEYDE